MKSVVRIFVITLLIYNCIWIPATNLLFISNVPSASAIGKKRFLGANWKSSLDLEKTLKFVNELNEWNDTKFNNHDICISPNLLYLPLVRLTLDPKRFQVAAQNGWHKSGAFTGEVPIERLNDFQVNQVILGHSERRQHCGETNEVISHKVKAAIDNGLNVILCIGETDVEKAAGDTFKVLNEQLSAVYDRIGDCYKCWDRIVVAYEPRWSIGTGKLPTSDDIKNAHEYIHNFISSKVPNCLNTRVIYGGSVTQSNSKDLINIQGVNGFLVGGASLEFNSLKGIWDNMVSVE